MRKSSVCVLVLALSLALSVLLGACSLPDGPAAPASGEQNELPAPLSPLDTPPADDTFGLAWQPEGHYNPVLSTGKLNQELAPLIFDPILRLNGAFEAEPCLAESFYFEENTLCLTLRVGVFFQDGSPLTAEDIVYTLNLARNDASSPYHRRLDGVSAVSEAEGQVKIVLRHRDSRFPEKLDIPVVKKNGEPYNGTGRYRLVEQGALAWLEQNDDYWGGAGNPGLARIELVRVAGPDALLESFEESYVDLVKSEPLSISALGFQSGSDVWRAETLDLHYLIFNTRRDPFSAPAVRRLVSDILMEGDLWGEVFGENAAPARSVFHPASPLAPETAVEETAIEDQFSALGFADFDGDGFYERCSFKKPEAFVPVLLVNIENSRKLAAARAIADRLARAGLKCSLLELPWGNYEKALARGEYDLCYAEVIQDAGFSLEGLLASGGSLNHGGYHSGEMDARIRAFQEADRANQLAGAQAISALVREEAPILPLFYQRWMVLTKRGIIKNLKPLQNDLFWNIIDWRVEKPF